MQRLPLCTRNSWNSWQPNVKVAIPSSQICYYILQVETLDIGFQCCMEPNNKDEHYKGGAQYKRVSFIGKPFILYLYYVFNSTVHLFHDKRARHTGLSAQRTKLRGPKGLQLEVRARRAPRLPVIEYCNPKKVSLDESICL